MKRKIIIEVDSEEETERIKHFLDKWVIDMFQDPSKVKVEIFEIEK